MQKKKNLNGGYVELLVLLVVVAIIAIVIVRTDLFKGKTLNPKTGEVENDHKNIIEGGFDAIDQAKDVKNMMEENARKTNEHLR